MIELLPCRDSAEMAAARQRELDLSHAAALKLGESAVEAIRLGYYRDRLGRRVDWSREVEQAQAARLSLPEDAPLPIPPRSPFERTRVEVTNETTLQAARRMVDGGARPLALNMANGVEPGGGLLRGARAQEESLCRSSALYATLEGDPMYTFHQRSRIRGWTAWSILSPDVPVFRDDSGAPLDRPWPLSFLTCAAPFAPAVGQPAASRLLEIRIGRLLGVARAFGYSSLVLGAWGCGAFENDPEQTARDFRQALERPFRGAFSDVVFAIADWSPQRRFLAPFRDGFQ